jgi:rare lipoprotein A
VAVLTNNSKRRGMKNQITTLLCAAALGAFPLASQGRQDPAPAGEPSPSTTPPSEAPAKHKAHKARAKRTGGKAAKGHELDHSGRAKKGKASYYAKSFAGKKMADGTPMNPNANIAASKTLPLGTKAEVVNLENGKSAQVEIRDRGPYVDGRIVDLSPKVAEKLDMREDGVAPVLVKPIEVPQPDGSMKLGAGARDAGVDPRSAVGSSDSDRTESGK